MSSNLEQGIKLFNEGEYFEAHEIWEELWQELEGPEKTQLQAMIQSSVALHLLKEKREKGAIKVWNRAISNFNKSTPVSLGILIEDFEAQIQRIFNNLEVFETTNVKIRLTNEDQL